MAFSAGGNMQVYVSIFAKYLILLINYVRSHEVAKYGENPAFNQSPHGEDMIKVITWQNFQKQVRVVTEWAEAIYEAAAALESDLQKERTKRISKDETVNFYLACLVMSHGFTLPNFCR